MKSIALENTRMDCVLCGERSTHVQTTSNDEKTVIILDAGWCFELIVVMQSLQLTVRCPKCSLRTILHPANYTVGPRLPKSMEPT